MHWVGLKSRSRKACPTVGVKVYAGKARESERDELLSEVSNGCRLHQ